MAKTTPTVEHHGQHHAANQPFCEECFEWSQAHTFTSGRLAGMEGICDLILERAQQAFAKGDDQLAFYLRRLAQGITEDLAPWRARLLAFHADHDPGDMPPAPK